MAFDEKLLFLDTQEITTNDISGTVLQIDETPVGGLGINVVIPQVVSTGSDGLSIKLYESDTSTWATMVHFQTLPTYKTAGSYWERLFSDKDYLNCRVTIVSAAADSDACDFGDVDVRLTSWMSKYAGQ